MKIKNNFVQTISELNPLGGLDFGRRATPKLVDFDGDGDLDLFVGNEAGTIDYLKNVGDKNTPQFVQQEGEANPFDGIVITEERSTPALADLDGDGVIDTAVVGNKEGTLGYFTYDGSKFVEQEGTANPFEGLEVVSRSAPTWADLNGDGNLDLVVGDGDGNINFFLNDGAKFTEQSEGDNPFNGIDVGFNATPTFQDVDGDGDLDGIVGDFYNDFGTTYLENIGTAQVPEFVERKGADNPFNNVSGILGNAPTLGDIDGDGDLDLLVGGVQDNTKYFVNSPTVGIRMGNVMPSETGETPGFFEVKLSEPAPASGLTIQYQVEETRKNSATAGEDYQPLSGIVKIAPGETTGKIEIQPIDDKEEDPVETVTVRLTAPKGYLIDGTKETVNIAIADNDGNPRLLEILNEPNFKDQYYLYNTENPGVDINVLKVWEDYSGKGVTVGVVDFAIYGAHPDLSSNFNPNFSSEDIPDTHSTFMAGIIAAEVGNKIGISGTAFNATLTSHSINGFTVEKINTALGEQVNVDVSNNPWFFTAFKNDFRTTDDVHDGIGEKKAIENAIKQGRNGLGTVSVWSAGNAREEGMNVNYANHTNSRYTIAVAALDTDGTFTDASSPGASLLVSAFGEEIFSTSFTGEEENISGVYNSDFGGTSSAVSMVSGVVALMLEANPELGYRDVQEILAYSAKWNDTSNESWDFNSADNWNGGGLHYSTDYGFGQVDALAAVRLAETWQTQYTAANEQKISVSSSGTVSIPDNDTAGVNDTLTVTEGVRIDQVEIDLEINHERYEDLIVTLTSPTGVASKLVDRIPGNEPDEEDFFKYPAEKVDGQDFLYTFSTNFDWGETGVGDWTLNVVDAATGNTGMVNNWTLNLYGDTITKNDTYIYTNDFANNALNDLASRQTLNDTNKGKDTINATAVSSNLMLNLRPGKTSTIAGREVTIASGTTIENAFGGDGNDKIWGNKKNNILNGGRGDDELVGKKGSNILTGGDGNDTFVFTKVQKNAFDTITDFEIGKDLLDVSSIIKTSDDDFEFEDYFQFVSQGSGTKVQVNESGDDDEKFSTIATLDNVNVNELTENQFIV